MTTFWGLTQQKGPWKSTPLDVFNSKSSLGYNVNATRDKQTLDPFVTSDYTDGNVANMDPSYLPFIVTSVVQSSRSLNSPMAIQLKAGKTTKRNMLGDKLKMGGKKDAEMTYPLDPDFKLKDPPGGNMPTDKINPAESGPAQSTKNYNYR